MTSLLISIIIPVYNVERFLSQCIESVISQSYFNWELLLVNDGSTDKSGKICDKYADKDNRISVIHKNNEGVSKARNKGLEKANGQWIAFLDADDEVQCDWLISLIPYLVRDWSIIRFGYSTYKGKSLLCNSIPEKENITDLLDFINSTNYAHAVWAYLFKKEFVDKYHIRFQEKLKYAEDQVFLLQCLNRDPKLYCVKNILYKYKLRDGSTVSIGINTQRAKTNLIAAITYVECCLNEYKRINRFAKNAIRNFVMDYYMYLTHCPDYTKSTSAKLYNEFYKNYKSLIPLYRRDLLLLLASIHPHIGMYIFTHPYYWK